MFFFSHDECRFNDYCIVSFFVNILGNRIVLNDVLTNWEKLDVALNRAQILAMILIIIIVIIVGIIIIVLLLLLLYRYFFNSWCVGEFFPDHKPKLKVFYKNFLCFLILYYNSSLRFDSVYRDEAQQCMRQIHIQIYT